MCQALAAVVVIASGWASQYDPSVMERVVAVRQIPRRTAHPLPFSLPQHDVTIAARDCGDIGQVWLVRKEGAGRWERALVADCAGSAATRAWMDRGNILLEIDGATARRWGVVGRGARIERGRLGVTLRGECVGLQ